MKAFKPSQGEMPACHAAKMFQESQVDRGPRSGADDGCCLGREFQAHRSHKAGGDGGDKARQQCFADTALHGFRQRHAQREIAGFGGVIAWAAPTKREDFQAFGAGFRAGEVFTFFRRNSGNLAQQY